MPADALVVHADCRHFRGDIPCAPNKEFGVQCDGCEYYDPVTENVLIIKLGAAGDVLRTTPILNKINKEHPTARIWWLTQSPELVPRTHVDRILKWSPEALETLSAVSFSRLINLDKDHFACALANRLDAKKKQGYLLNKFGVTIPADEAANHKYLTGIFDDVSMKNTRSYMDEMFEICGYQFAGEKYILSAPINANFPELDTTKPIIGMNTGAGMRWTSRLWSTASWAELAKQLHAQGYNVVLLGGPDEDARNREIESLAGGAAKYLGHFPLTQFIGLVDKCTLLISGVTMAFHIGLALEKRIVLINNIFNKHEFGDLYGQGEIIEPDKPCICYFRGTCINKDYFCLDHLPVEKVAGAVKRQIRL
jgi:ADP-heptose:LPS heptosyltransferase